MVAMIAPTPQSNAANLTVRIVHFGVRCVGPNTICATTAGRHAIKKLRAAPKMHCSKYGSRISLTKFSVPQCSMEILTVSFSIIGH